MDIDYQWVMSVDSVGKAYKVGKWHMICKMAKLLKGKRLWWNYYVGTMIAKGIASAGSLNPVRVW